MVILKMEIIVAVDLMDGKVVRLTRGDPKTKVSYPGYYDPIQVSKRWESEGADSLHVIDLDAALGRGENTEAVTQLLREVNIPIQFGGGIRSIAKAKKLLNSGVSKIVLGTLAFESSNSIYQLIREYQTNRVVVALDYLKGEVKTRGWTSSANEGVLDALLRFKSMGIKRFLLTSISRDGVPSGPDFDMIKKASEISNVQIIAAGGVSSIDDVEALYSFNISGVVLGKALYEGRLNLKQVLSVTK
jgi:phosphoribosylformimino-5-aminoimidazole carboxamide ribotide isomerase